MRWSIIKKLYFLNINYANTKKVFNNNYQKTIQKYFTKTFISTLFLSVLSYFFAYYTSGKLYGFLIGFILFVSIIDLNETVYNLFYESTDSLELLNLPLKPSEIFIAKMLILADYLVVFLIPLLVYGLCGLYFNANLDFFNFLNIILVSLLLILAIISFSVIINALFVRTNFFIKNKTIFKTIKSILVMILSFSGYLIKNINFKINNSDLDGLILNSFSFDKLKIVIGLIFLNLLLAFIIYQSFIKNYFTTLKKLHQVIKVKKQKTAKTLKMILIKRNLELLKNSTVITNAILPCFYFILPFINNFNIFKDIYQKHTHLVFTSYIFTILSAFILVNHHSFLAVGISLEKEELLYIKLLPINFKEYLKIKFMCLFTASALIYNLILIVFMILIGFNFIDFIINLALFNLIILARSFKMFIYDYKHLKLDFNNINILYQRHDKLFYFAICLIGFVCVVMLLALLINIANNFKFSSLLLLQPIILISAFYTYYHFNKFKKMLTKIR